MTKKLNSKLVKMYKYEGWNLLIVVITVIVLKVLVVGNEKMLCVQMLIIN